MVLILLLILLVIHHVAIDVLSGSISQCFLFSREINLSLLWVRMPVLMANHTINLFYSKQILPATLFQVLTIYACDQA